MSTEPPEHRDMLTGVVRVTRWHPMAAPTPTIDAADVSERADDGTSDLDAPPVDGAEATFRSLLPFVVLVGFVLRVGYTVLWRWNEGLLYDAPAYRTRATFLRSGRAFLDADLWVFHERAVQGAVHPPGNTLLVALGMELGFETDNGLRLWGCLIGAATIAAIGLLGRAVAGPRVGLIAAAIAAVHPGFWSFDPTVMAETPGQLITAITLLLAYRFWQAPSPSRAGWLAAAAAAAALVRSELALLLILLVAPLCLASRGTPRQVATRFGAAVLWSVVVLGPWVGWNLVRFEHPTTLATGLDLSMAYAQCDATWYGRDTGSWNVFCGAEITADPANDEVDASELGQQYRARAGSYIADHLERWPVVLAARAGRTLGLYPPGPQIDNEAGREGREVIVLVGALVATLASYALAAIAFVARPELRRRLLPLLTPLAAGVAGALLTFGTSRYRSAGEVGLVVLAAVGIDVLARRVTDRRRQGEPDPEPPTDAEEALADA